MTWPPLEVFKQMVATEWGLEPVQLESKARIQSLVWPRQAAMYLAREVGLYPLTEIGKAFHRDHSTVNHSVQMVKKRVLLDRDFKAKLDVVLDQLTEIRHITSTNVGKSAVGNGVNSGSHMPSTEFPHAVYMLEGPKPIDFQQVGLTQHIPTDSTITAISYNRVLEALSSIPDPEAQALIRRAWIFYTHVAAILPEVYP